MNPLIVAFRALPLFQKIATVLVVAGVIAYCGDVAVRFSKTSHGANPWTMEAYSNTLRIARHVNRVMKLIGGTLNDSYRSPSVNKAVGGVSNSYHQLGLAADIKPGMGLTVEKAARLVYSQAAAGTLGPMRTVIWEPTWVHVDFHNPADVGPPPPVRFFKLVAPGKYETVKP